jgi:hypothetical protein
MKLVIHAGIHRTGTTSLQLFLAENRAALLALGISYPGDKGNHQSLAWALKRGEGIGNIRAIINSKTDVDTVILSAEDFCIHTDLQWLKEISREHDTRVVFYLRRQDHWLMSWYNQHVKWPFDRNKSQMDKNDFLNTIGDFHWLDYKSLMDRWAAVLGSSKVSAGVLEAGQVEDVIGDFVTRLEIPRDGLNFEVKRVNDSLPVHMLEIARNLGMFDLHAKARIRLIRALRVGLADKTQPLKTIYSPQERREVLERFQSSNQAAANLYFGRGSLFMEPLPQPDEPFYTFPEMSHQELMRDWIAPVIKHFLPPP